MKKTAPADLPRHKYDPENLSHQDFGDNTSGLGGYDPMTVKPLSDH